MRPERSVRIARRWRRIRRSTWCGTDWGWCLRGAAIGRAFSHALLIAVVHTPEPELASALDRLIAAGLLFRQGVPPHATYLFKHALVQDAAYGTLLRERRRALHARIAETLEGQFAEIAENQPEILARHLTEAGRPEHAVEQWLKAGRRAAGRSAYVEAIAHLKQGLELLVLLPDWGRRSDIETDLQLALGVSLFATKGLASPEDAVAYERARALCEASGDIVRPPWVVKAAHSSPSERSHSSFPSLLSAMTWAPPLSA